MGKSTTMTSVKNLGSRLSSMLPGRGRSDTLVSGGKSKSIGAVDEKDAAVPSITYAEGSPANIKYEYAYMGRPRLVTIKKNRMDVMSTAGFFGNIDDETLIVRTLMHYHK
jgi:hypothetical protein